MNILLPLLLTVSPITKPANVLFTDGECAVIRKQQNIQFDPTMLVMIEGYDEFNQRYLYRWWTIQGGWSVEEGKAVGEQNMFNRLFTATQCPAPRFNSKTYK